jgi:hypothetical protein
MDRLTTLERFESYTVRTETCWLWTGTTGRFYGRFRTGRDSRYGRSSVYAHRFAFETSRRRLLPGENLHHICENKLCVNPDHLVVTTPSAHMHAHRMGERLAALKRAATHCQNGHEFSSDNTYWYQGRRSCRECRRKTTRESAARRRAKAKA